MQYSPESDSTTNQKKQSHRQPDNQSDIFALIARRRIFVINYKRPELEEHFSISGSNDGDVVGASSGDGVEHRPCVVTSLFVVDQVIQRHVVQSIGQTVSTSRANHYAGLLTNIVIYTYTYTILLYIHILQLCYQPQLRISVVQYRKYISAVYLDLSASSSLTSKVPAANKLFDSASTTL